MPAPFHTLDRAKLAKADRLYFDVDDTLTFRGKLPASALASLEAAKKAGLSLVAVTGRSAAWGEMMLRVLPLDAVIAETGALCFYYQKNGAAAVMHSEPNAKKRNENAARREKVAAKILSEVKNARLALDNLGRLYDTAFDLNEDGDPLSEADAAAIRSRLEQDGITWAQSSVHINAWIGFFDKASMVDRFLQEVEHTSLDDAAERLLYLGDSTNDGAMFCRTPLSIGVANVAPHLEALRQKNQAPSFITEAEAGLGFTEVVQALLAARAGA